MNRHQAASALQRALEISHELVAVADGGDLELTVSLDAERLQLLKSARAALQPMGEKDRTLLREIAALNDRALGHLEHRRRAKGRDMDMLAVGRRAVRAYSNTRMRR
jgi:hypothetical protein